MVISDFDDGIPDWQFVQKPEILNVFESNGRLTLSAQLPYSIDNLGNSRTGVAWSRIRPVLDGMSLETRVDLVGASRADVMAGLDYNSTDTPERGIYIFIKDANQLMLQKVQLSPDRTSASVARFFYEPTHTKHTNVVMSMVLTGIGSSVNITVKVLDKDAGEAVLYERSVLDTPGIEPTTHEGPVLPNLAPDPGPPFVMGTGPFLYLLQVTDGLQPVAEVMYDNFTYEYRSAVRLSIERIGQTLQLTWPGFVTPFLVEKAPALEGPWTEVMEPVSQSNFTNWVTVPISDTQGYYQLREDPEP